MKTNKYNWKSSIISSDYLIEDVIKNLNETNLQIALLYKSKLIGTVTDGDIRRVLKGFSLNESKQIMKKFITVGKILVIELQEI